jgi:tetratricopeptide (TPR) repeat protein
LGFALATTEKLADALKNLAKADELGCTPENFVQLCDLLGTICLNLGRYDDALVHLSKAEQLVGVDLDILQRKAVIYGINDDIRNGLEIANQIKLISPSEYLGYKIAFKLLIQAKRLEAAEQELEKAKKYATPTMDFYFDCVTFELEKFQEDHDRAHFRAALDIIEKGLKTVEPAVTATLESYLNAAEIYLQLEEPDRAIDCLNAAQNPIGAYNNGFEVVVNEAEPVTLTDYDIEDMIEADKQKIADELGDYGLEELVESIEPDEEGAREYLTEIEDEPEEAASAYKLDESEQFEFTPENIDQINRLSVGAFTLKRDFDKVIEYAKLLQASESIYYVYMGKYVEANALKELGSLEAAAKYEEAIRFFRNAMIKDPTDIMAVTFRIQCLVDSGKYEEAEELCNLLSKEVKEPLLEKIAEAKSGGD